MTAGLGYSLSNASHFLGITILIFLTSTHILCTSEGIHTAMSEGKIIGIVQFVPNMLLALPLTNITYSMIKAEIVNVATTNTTPTITESNTSIDLVALIYLLILVINIISSFSKKKRLS